MGLATLLGALGAVWAAQPSGASTPGPKRRTRADTGTLKGVTGFFTGRTKEWAAVEAAVDAVPTPQKIQAAFMIHGMPGVGKSELAQYAAHQLVSKVSNRAQRLGLEMVPRQVELHGLEGLGRTDPKDALHALLNLDSTDRQRSTMSLDELSAEWRKSLDEKFLILLLDNANDENQVLPFIPGGSGYVVLVTSRRVLQGLLARGVRALPLHALPKDDAVELIKKIANRSITEGDQQAIEDIAEICGCHPLAITLAVSPLARNSNISFVGRLAQLREKTDRLLAIDEYANEESGGVARSFELSYMQLPDERKLILRRVGLAPVPIISVEATAALADLPIDVVDDHLHELETEALIEQDGDGYHLHDLIRHYARSLAAHDDPAENEAAVNRMLAYYHAAAAYVDSIFTRQPPPLAIEPPAPTVIHDFADRPSAIAWARAELPNLLACADYVVRIGEGDDRAQEKAWIITFASALAGLLRNDGLWLRSIELQTQAVAAADEIHSLLAVANALHERGLLRRLTGDLEAAVDDLERAITIFHEVGGDAGKTGEAHALNTCGVVLDQLKLRTEGRERLSSSLDIYRHLNNRLGEANVLHDRGMAEFFEDNCDEAANLFGRALALYQAVDHLLGKAHANANLAKAEHRIGLDREAAEHLESAQMLYHDLGNQLGEVTTLIQLGAILRQQDRGRAASTLYKAIGLSRQIGNQLGLINAMGDLAELREAEGDRAVAVYYWMRALKICRKHGIHREESRLVNKLTSLGLRQQTAGDFREKGK